MTDDAFISLRYAGRLLEGQGLTWTAGEAVEGYTNFLWVMAIAFGGWLGVDLVTAARVLGLLGMAAALAAVMLCVWNRGQTTLLAMPAAGLGFAFAGPVAVWAIGGLEQPLLTALMAWVFYFLMGRIEEKQISPRQMVVPGILLGLVCLTRADGALFTVAVCLGWMAARGFDRKTIRQAAGLAAISFAFFLGHLLFRLHYYGQWIPNTALIKTQFSALMLFRGVKYLAKGLLFMMPLLIPVIAGWIAARRNQGQASKVRFLMVVGAIWSGYVILIGGDYFVAHRHLTPLVLILAILAGLGVSSPAFQGQKRVWAAAAGLIGLYAFLQIAAPANRAARQETWEKNGEVVGRFLLEAFDDREPLLAVTAAGALPYYSKLPALDMLGLNDRHIASHAPTDPDRFKPAHQFGDGAYVLTRKPDLVVFCEPGGCIDPIYRSGIEMVRDPSWSKLYRLVIFEAEKPYRYQSKIYVRAEDGKIGVRREGDSITIPGYLFSANPQSIARLDDRGAIAMTATGDLPAEITALDIPKGNWLMTVRASGPVMVELRPTGKAGLFQSDSSELQFESAADQQVDITIRPLGEGVTWVYEATIRRAEG